MARILLYGFATGVMSSQTIAWKCADDTCFRWLAAGQIVDRRAVARFRRAHLDALTSVFVQVLERCQSAGVVRLGRIPLYGMTRGSIVATILDLMDAAERTDAAEHRTPVSAPATPNARRGLVGALLVALIRAGGYTVAATKRVTLCVDGVSTRVSTMKWRVGDILRDNGHSVGEHDEVSPNTDQSVQAADTIVLRRARPLRVSVDGQPGEQVWTTGLTVNDALGRLPMDDVAPVAASRTASVPLTGMELRVVTPKQDQINDGGVLHERQLAAATVGQLLVAAGAPLQEADTVSPSASTPVVAGMHVVVTRIRVPKVSERLPLPAPLPERVGASGDDLLDVGAHPVELGSFLFGVLARRVIQDADGAHDTSLPVVHRHAKIVVQAELGLVLVAGERLALPRIPHVESLIGFDDTFAVQGSAVGVRASLLARRPDGVVLGGFPSGGCHHHGVRLRTHHQNGFDPQSGRQRFHLRGDRRQCRRRIGREGLRWAHSRIVRTIRVRHNRARPAQAPFARRDAELAARSNDPGPAREHARPR